MQWIFIKKYFLFTVGSVCRVKRFRVAETTVKRLLCCGVRRTGKVMGQVYINVGGVFFRFQYHMFYVLYTVVKYLLTLPSYVRLRTQFVTTHA
jgi:hypothetical protein